MFKKNFAKIQKYLFPTLILLLVGIISWENYVSGTILSGWDALHPEFDFGLAFRQGISGVWREAQGVGSIAAHSHMADLPRVLLLWISSFVLPIHFLRYFYLFLCLAAGPLGVYYFLKYSFDREKSSFTTSIASFLGAMYFLLNLGTLQFFYVPFEMFTTQYALLPWLFLLALKYVREKKAKTIYIFAIISIFASPMGYAATLFYPYLLSLALFLSGYWLLSKNKKEVFKKSFIVFLTILITNAYWIFPNIYSVVNQADIISSSRINTLFSPEAFLRNKDYGTISNILIQKNFLFSWRAYDHQANIFVDLLNVWIDYLQNTSILAIGYILAGLGVLGALFSFIWKNKIGLILLPIGILSLFFLINTNPPSGAIYSYLYENVDLFREGFRMPFAKFSILFSFVASYYFGYFQFGILSAFSKKSPIKKAMFLQAIAVFIALLVYMKPVFDGHLIAPFLRTNIPEEYFQVFEWFDNEENGRIAKFPIHTPFNWEFHDWGYEGSGWFIWFGMANPQFDRDFDRWSPYNESFYNEASFALYAGNLEDLESALEKYQVSYLLLDESILNAGGSEELLRIDEIKKMLAESSHTKIVKKFDFLSIYETDFGKNKNYLSTPESYVLVDGDTKYSEQDVIYAENGVYVEDKEGLTYPYANFDERAGIDIEIEKDNVNFYSLPLGFSGTKKLAVSDNSNVVSIELDDEKRVKATMSIEKRVEEDFSLGRGFDSGYNCDLKKIGSVSKENDGTKIIYKAFDGGVSCDFFSYPNLSYSQGYILRISGENKEGRSLKFYLQNKKTKRMDLEELLPEGQFDEVYVILPKNIDGSGYTLNLETRSYGRVSSENILEKIEFIPVPIALLQEVKLVPDSYSNVGNDVEIIESRKLGTSYYSVRTNSEEGLVVLGQGYESGWLGFGFKKDNINFFNKAFPWFFGDYLKHVKVNSWANGWFVPENNQKLILVFWPQYLEYFGMAISVIGLIWLYNKKGKPHLTVDKGKGRRLK